MEAEDKHCFFGVHILGEMFGVDPSLLNDLTFLEESLSEGIRMSGATLCGIQSKQFEPNGVTILGLLSESHVSIHTYPEEGSLFFDAFTCGHRCQPELIAKTLSLALNPKKENFHRIERGDKTELRQFVLPLSVRQTTIVDHAH